MNDLEEHDPETIFTDLRSLGYLSFLILVRWILISVLWILAVASIAILLEVLI